MTLRTYLISLKLHFAIEKHENDIGIYPEGVLSDLHKVIDVNRWAQSLANSEGSECHY